MATSIPVFQGPLPSSTPLQQKGKETEIASSAQSARASAENAARERAKFILENGVAPEDVRPNKPVGDLSKTGEEYLATVPQNIATDARMLANGDLQWPTGRALINPRWSQALNAARQAYPDLTQDVWTSRHNANVDARPGGKLGQNAAAINTALGHLEDLWKQYQRLGNTRFEFINGKWQEIRTGLGDQDIQNAKAKAATAAQGVANELGKIMVGGGAGHVGDIDQWKAKLDLTAPPAAFAGTINEALNMIKSRLDTTQGAYDAAMLGHKGQWNALDQRGARIFSDLNKATNWEGSQGGGGEVQNGTTRGVLEAPPEGMHLQGQGIKGFRYTPEQQSMLDAYLRSEHFEPETYANMASAAQKAQSGAEMDPAARAAFMENGKNVNAYYRKNPTAPSVPIDYSAVDKAATENAGLGDTVAQMVRNLPTSAANLATGVLAPATDVVRSVAAGKRQGVYEAIPNAVGDIFGANTGTLNALGENLKEKYGSLANIKRSMITDPLGIPADISMAATLGGAGLSRLPGMAGRVGEAASTVGRVVDPLSGAVALTTEGLPALLNKYPVAGAARRGAGAVGNAVAEAAAFPSGVGGTTLREGYEAGKTQGLAGAPTPQSEAFTANMRNGTENASDAVALARNAVSNLRDAASRRYQAAMAQFGREPVPLSPDNLRDTMASMKPANYDTMLDAPHRPSDHLAWQQMNDTVEHYLNKAEEDPSLLTPLAVDQFKQDLYTIGSKVGGASDRDAARIAGNAYRAVRKMLTDHDPVYATTMKDYGDAAQEAASLESGFSLSSPRGKPVNVDAASRKLQSILRNNANTNYGQRAAQGERLAELDPTGTLMPTLAGQSASSPTPRGLRGNVEAAGLAGEGLRNGIFGLLSPKLALALAPTSPRVMGELAYGAGRGVGAAQRVGEAVAPSISKAGTTLADLYNKYPDLALATSEASKYADATDQQQRDDFLRKHNMYIDVPAIGGQ